MDFLSPALTSASAFLAADPAVLFMQMVAVIGATLVVFLVLFATRDVMLRSHSFLFQIFCILLTALLPVFGFLVYLLIRPPRTIAERRLEHRVSDILSRLHPKKGEQRQAKK